MDDIESHFYLRFTVPDRPGVLSRLSGVLGKHQISISSVSQKGREHMRSVPIVIMTHSAPERNIRTALGEIDQSEIVKAPTQMIRIEPDLP
jgi:homoserine dehydrogenase